RLHQVQKSSILWPPQPIVHLAIHDARIPIIPGSKNRVLRPKSLLDREKNEKNVDLNIPSTISRFFQLPRIQNARNACPHLDNRQLLLLRMKIEKKVHSA